MVPDKKLKNYIKTSLSDFLNEQQLNEEISSDTFKRAINLSKQRGTDRRTFKLGELYLNRFMGKDLMDGNITKIGVLNPQQGNYNQVAIEITENDTNRTKNYIHYDIDEDSYIHMESYEIERKDAVVLSKIAQHVNPNTKYKETGKYFKIKGW